MWAVDQGTWPATWPIGAVPLSVWTRVARCSTTLVALMPGSRSWPGTRAVDAPLETCAGVLARFSLIHVEPTALPGIVRGWHRRVRAGTLLLVAAQASDDSGVHEFDHLVSRAWRWHPDSLAQMLGDNGFDEEFRVVSRPDADNRFPAVHLLCRSR